VDDFAQDVAVAELLILGAMAHQCDVLPEGEFPDEAKGEFLTVILDPRILAIQGRGCE
jgi:hypothetical protein